MFNELVADGRMPQTKRIDKRKLSGSGKAVANLALRLSLGQVLGNKVFSLFIGDEIDASLDKDRAENCAQTLQAVRGSLSQIVLISHKTIPADYCIDLKPLTA